MRAASILGAGLLALLITGCSAAPQRTGRPVPLRANPSAVIAAELALARAAQEKGQWTAFAEAAAEGAVILAPEPVDARTWLKGRANPAQALRWQPYDVWSSCDGSIAVTRGAWQGPGAATGYFVAVWERQPNGSFKWLLKSDQPLSRPLPRPELAAGMVADCGSVPHPVAATHERVAYVKQGQSTDGTLHWDFSIAAGARPELAPELALYLWRGGQMQRVEIAPLAEGGQ